MSCQRLEPGERIVVAHKPERGSFGSPQLGAFGFQFGIEMLVGA